MSERPAGASSPKGDVVSVATGAPAELVTRLSLSRPQLSVGQQATLKYEVQNAGGSFARNVSPTVPNVSGVGRASVEAIFTATEDIAPGASTTFEFVVTGAQSGAVQLEVGATGFSESDGAALQVSPAVAPMMIQGASTLTISSLTAPARANVGVDFTLTMTVSNSGEATAHTVAPSALTLGTGLQRISGPTPASATIVGGASQTFTWVLRPTTAGTATVSASAAGLDLNTSQPISAAAITTSIGLDTPALLVGTLSIPGSLSTNQSFVATLLVRNTGSAVAKVVAPVARPADVAGGAGATSTSVAPPMDIPGNGSATFTWTFTATGTGALQLTVAAQGTDANSGASISSGTVTSNSATVSAPASLAITSFSAPTTVAQGANFSVTMTLANGGAALTNVNANPNPPSAVGPGAAGVTLVTPQPAVSIAAGAAATNLTWVFKAGNTAGPLSFTAGARGTLAGGTVINANTAETNLTTVVAPPPCWWWSP